MKKNTGLLKHLQQLRIDIATIITDAKFYQNVTVKNYGEKLQEGIEFLRNINKDISVIEDMEADGTIDLGSIMDSKIEKFMERLPDLYKQIMTAMDDIRNDQQQQQPMFAPEDEWLRRDNVRQSPPYKVLLAKRDNLLDELCHCGEAARIIAITQELQPVAHAMQFMMVADLSFYSPDADAAVDNQPQ